MNALIYKGEDVSLILKSENDLSGFTKAVKFFTFGSAVKTATITAIDNYRFSAKLASADTADLPSGTLNIVVEFSDANGKKISKTINAKIADPYVDGGERGVSELEADIVFMQNQEISVYFGVVHQDIYVETNAQTLTDAKKIQARSNIGLGNVTNESKAAMFNNPTFTGTVTGISKSMVGLGNVDNTSDANKPVSTAQQAAIDMALVISL